MNNTIPLFDPSLFNITTGTHQNQNIIWIRFPYDLQLIQIVKTIPKARWSQSNKAWYLPDLPANRILCGLPERFYGKEVLSKIELINQAELKKLEDILILKSYSSNTIKTYTIEFAQLLYAIKKFPVFQLNKEKLQSYFLYCAKELKLSENQLHSRMNAIKFYFETVLHQDKMFFDIPRPKKALSLPKSLHSLEIKKIFAVTDNIKHRLILQLCYGMGLRVSEIVSIRIEDVDSLSMRVFILRGKGKKDRYVNLPQSTLDDLRIYYKQYKPKLFLFEGQNGEQYSKRSVQLIFKNAMKKAGIKKSIGVHGLRHSYASHLLQYGTDISLIQKLLGHNDIKTTLIYTNISDTSVKNVASPLDRM